MKNFSKLTMIILLLNMDTVQAFPSGYSIFNGYFKVGRFISVFRGPAISTKYRMEYHKKIKNSPDTPQIITHFCHKKLREHGLNPEQILIKVKEDCGFIEAFGTSYIVFSPIATNEFKNALENPSDQTSINIVNIYSTFLDHEIAHIKNNDTLKRYLILLGISTCSYGAATYFIRLPHVNSLFQKPTNKKELGRAVIAYGLINIATGHFIKNLYGWYARYQENRADTYAISHAKDPQALRYAANFLEITDHSIIEFLCGADLSPSIPFINKASLIFLRHTVVELYKTLQPEEDFRTWVKQQTTILLWVKYLVDVEHPSGFYRAETMRAAANTLEAKQNITVDTIPPQAIQTA